MNTHLRENSLNIQDCKEASSNNAFTFVGDWRHAFKSFSTTLSLKPVAVLLAGRRLLKITPPGLSISKGFYMNFLCKLGVHIFEQEERTETIAETRNGTVKRHKTNERCLICGATTNSQTTMVREYSAVKPIIQKQRRIEFIQGDELHS